MKSEMLDESKPFDEVFGLFDTYKYSQDGKFFGPNKMRVDEKTGKLWSEEDEEKDAEIEMIELAAEMTDDVELDEAAKMVSDGIEVPKRLRSKAERVIVDDVKKRGRKTLK